LLCELPGDPDHVGVIDAENWLVCWFWQSAWVVYKLHGSS
jgi:hypothetical protein